MSHAFSTPGKTVAPTEVIAETLHRLGGTAVVDDRLSWVPRGEIGYQPINAYLLAQDEELTLVDTGVAAHATAVLAGLAALDVPDLPLSVFLTRSEYDCIGNLAAIVERFPISALFTGGITNPFDAFDEITSPYGLWTNRVRLGSIPRGTSVPLGQSTSMVVLAPAIRTLTTFWAYDLKTKALFTSDLFGHGLMRTPQEAPLLRAGDGSPDATVVRRHLLAKFNWLAQASRVDVVIAHLDEIFERHDVEIIAPTHGKVIVGRDVVADHVCALREVLVELARASAAQRNAYPLPRSEPEGHQPAPGRGQRSMQRSLPREIAPGIHWIGKCLEGNSVSMIMPGSLRQGAPHHSHLSNYLILGSEQTLMIDTGIPSSWAGISEQLDLLLGHRDLDWLFPTHPEYPHSGNLEKLMQKYPEARVVGDMRDYHLFFPEIEGRTTDMGAHDLLDLGGGYVVEFLPALLRDLPSSLWLLEESQRVLFVADGFGFFHRQPQEDEESDLPLHQPGECALFSSELDLPMEVEQAALIVANALSWSQYTDPTAIFEELEKLLSHYRPRIIAPAHGNVIDQVETVLPLIRASHEAAYARARS